jgi:hypothetical protein
VLCLSGAYRHMALTDGCTVRAPPGLSEVTEFATGFFPTAKNGCWVLGMEGGGGLWIPSQVVTGE